MLIPGIFGTTRDIEVVYLAEEFRQLGINFEKAWIEVHPNQAKLDTKENIIKIYRKRIGKNILTFIGIYRAAFEIGFRRDGGYYGAGVWLINGNADPKILLKFLNNIADQISALAHSNDQFIKALIDIKDQITVTDLWSDLIESFKKIEPTDLPEGDGVGYFTADQYEIVANWQMSTIRGGKLQQAFIGPAHLLNNNKMASRPISSNLSSFLANQISELENVITEQNSNEQKLRKKINEDELLIGNLKSDLKKLKQKSSYGINKFQVDFREILLTLSIPTILFIANTILFRIFGNDTSYNFEAYQIVLIASTIMSIFISFGLTFFDQINRTVLIPVSLVLVLITSVEITYWKYFTVINQNIESLNNQAEKLTKENENLKRSNNTLSKQLENSSKVETEKAKNENQLESDGADQIKKMSEAASKNKPVIANGPEEKQQSPASDSNNSPSAPILPPVRDYSVSAKTDLEKFKAILKSIKENQVGVNQKGKEINSADELILKVYTSNNLDFYLVPNQIDEDAKITCDNALQFISKDEKYIKISKVHNGNSVKDQKKIFIRATCESLN